MESVPKELRNLRACLICSMVKATPVKCFVSYRPTDPCFSERKKNPESPVKETLEQFEYDGCDNCEKFLRLKNNKENILTCTSANFDGLISLMTPEDSWVARWQRIDTLARGCYAISVSGKLPGHVVRDLKARGVTYKSRDRTNQ